MGSLMIATMLGLVALMCASMATRYGAIAEQGTARQSMTSNRWATWWATAAAIFGLVGVFIGVWPGPN